MLYDMMNSQHWKPEISSFSSKGFLFKLRTVNHAIGSRFGFSIIFILSLYQNS